MPAPEKSRIVVLHLTKFSDHGVVLHTIDSLGGRRSYLVRGLKRGSAVAAFHPLNILDIYSSQSPKSSMAFLREWEPVSQMPGLRGDMAKRSVAMFLSEVLYRSFTSEMADEALFQWLCEAVLLLDGAPGSVANFHLWFLAGYAVKLGFMPGETVEPQGLFDPRGDTLFHRLLESPFEDAMAIPLSSERRRDFSRSMLRYLSWHLGVNIEARSLEVLHEVLG